MIRWSYLRPKLIKIGILWIFFALLFDPIARWALQAGASRALGAKVEIGHLKTKFFPPSVKIQRVAAADPSEPMKNLLEFSLAEFKLEGRPLLEKKIVIDAASLEGIAWGTARKTSGALPRSKPSPAVEKVKSWVENKSMNLFTSASENAKADVTREYKIEPQDLSSVKLADDLQSRWPSSFQSTQKQLDSLNIDTKIKDVQALADQISKSGNAVQKIENVKKLQDQIKALRQQLSDSKGSVEKQINQAKSDVSSVETAKKNDLDAVMQRLHLPSFDTERVSAYLIGPAAAKKLATAVRLVEMVRAKMPKKTKGLPPPAPPERMRGLTVEFPKEHSWPEFWLRHASLSGSAELGGPVAFSGAADNFSSNPPLIAVPAAAHVSGGGGGRTISAKATLDHTTDVAKDRLDFTYAGLPIAETSAGDPKSFSVTIGPGTANVSGSIEFDDAAMHGTVRFTERGVTIRPVVGDISQDMARIVSHAFRGINTLDAEVALGGNLDNPDFKISTNLGKALADGLKQAVGGEIQARRAQIEKQIDTLVQGKIDALNSQLEGQNKAWLGKLGAGDQKLKELEDQAAKQIKLPVNQLPDIRKILKFP